MKMLYKILGFCLCILPLQLCFAKEIVVDINGTGNFTTIQAAIDNAVNGDTVLVLPGTYFENINYKGKNICVISKAGPDSTIIDGSQPQDFTYRSVVTFLSREDISPHSMVLRLQAGRDGTLNKVTVELEQVVESSATWDLHPSLKKISSAIIEQAVEEVSTLRRMALIQLSGITLSGEIKPVSMILSGRSPVVVSK